MTCHGAIAWASLEYFFVGAATDQRCQFTSIQDALTAAAANGPDLDYVMVANTAGHTNQALFIGNQSVRIQGGYRSRDLDDDEDQPYAAISGNASDPVIRVEPLAAAAYTNYRVVLSRLRLSGGGRDDANGGGLRVVTAANVGVRVRIEGNEITGNRAYNGAGVYLLKSTAAQAGSPELTIYPGTRIHANTAAQLGGGLHVSGGLVFMAPDAVSIDHNTAAGAGGGIMLQPGTLFVDNAVSHLAAGPAPRRPAVGLNWPTQVQVGPSMV